MHCVFPFSFILVIIALSGHTAGLCYCERLKEIAEDAEWEMALKDIAVATAKDKSRATEAAEKKA